MTTEELQKKYDRLFGYVERMRTFQKKYFKYHASADLESANKNQKVIDQIIKEENAEKSRKQLSIL